MEDACTCFLDSGGRLIYCYISCWMKNNDNLSCFIFSFLFVHIIILFALIQEFQIFSIVSSISLIIINNNNNNNSYYYNYCYYFFQQTSEIYIDSSKEREIQKDFGYFSRRMWLHIGEVTFRLSISKKHTHSQNVQVLYWRVRRLPSLIAQLLLEVETMAILRYS